MSHPMTKLALSNKWYVYYACDADTEEELGEPGSDDWNEYNLAIHPLNNEMDDGERVLSVAYGGMGEGWRKIMWQEDWRVWPYPLPQKAYREFIKACFMEF